MLLRNATQPWSSIQWESSLSCAESLCSRLRKLHRLWNVLTAAFIPRFSHNVSVSVRSVSFLPPSLLAFHLPHWRSESYCIHPATLLTEDRLCSSKKITDTPSHCLFGWPFSYGTPWEERIVSDFRCWSRDGETELWSLLWVSLSHLQHLQMVGKGSEEEKGEKIKPILHQLAISIALTAL